MKTVVIIGSAAAGTVTGLTIKSIKPEYNVIIIGKEKNFFVRCSAPYVIGGISKLNKCIKPDAMITSAGIRLIKDEVISVDPKKKEVKTKNKRFSYDYLVFATGAKPFIPPIEGVNLKNVFTVRTAEDTKKIARAVKKARNILIVGGGMIGIELAALLSKKHKVTVVELLPHILYAGYDDEFCKLVEDNLRKNKVNVLTNKKVERILGRKKVNAVVVSGRKIKTDVVILSVGIRSDVALAQKAGIKIGKFGIKTDNRMRTNIPNIYAVGDCAQAFSSITRKPIPSGLVSTAIIEGKIAGMNICGIDVKFNGVTNPSVTKIFDYSLGRVGFTEREAKKEGIHILVGRSETLEKYDTQPNAKKLVTKLVFDSKKRLIGAQILGHGNVVAGLVDFLSYAIQNKATVDELKQLHYSAHPELTALPFFHPIVMACESVKE